MEHYEKRSSNSEGWWALIFSEDINPGQVTLACQWEFAPSQEEVQEWFDVYPHGEYPIHPEQYAEDCPWHPATVDKRLQVFDQHGTKVARVVCLEHNESIRRKRGGDNKMRAHRQARAYVEVEVWDDSPWPIWADHPAAHLRLRDEGMEIAWGLGCRTLYSWNQVLKAIAQMEPESYGTFLIKAGPLPEMDEE
mgnify:CR=1 FL=1